MDSQLTAQNISSRANDAQRRMSGVSGRVADGTLAMSGIAVQQTGMTSIGATQSPFISIVDSDECGSLRATAALSGIEQEEDSGAPSKNMRYGDSGERESASGHSLFPCRPHANCRLQGERTGQVLKQSRLRRMRLVLAVVEAEMVVC